MATLTFINSHGYLSQALRRVKFAKLLLIHRSLWETMPSLRNFLVSMKSKPVEKMDKWKLYPHHIKKPDIVISKDAWSCPWLRTFEFTGNARPDLESARTATGRWGRLPWLLWALQPRRQPGGYLSAMLTSSVRSQADLICPKTILTPNNNNNTSK